MLSTKALSGLHALAPSFKPWIRVYLECEVEGLAWRTHGGRDGLARAIEQERARVPALSGHRQKQGGTRRGNLEGQGRGNRGRGKRGALAEHRSRSVSVGAAEHEHAHLAEAYGGHFTGLELRDCVTAV